MFLCYLQLDNVVDSFLIVKSFHDDRGFSWDAAVLAGAILSATDPVAVVALLKELGASPKLATLIEGESLLNDGTAMVVFLVVLELVEGEHLTGG